MAEAGDGTPGDVAAAGRGGVVAAVGVGVAVGKDRRRHVLDIRGVQVSC